MTKNESLALKGLAILLMVFHHCFGFPGRIEDVYVTTLLDHTFYIELAKFGKICVSIFMVIAGYAMALSLSNKNFSVKSSILRTSNLFVYTFVILVLFVPFAMIFANYDFSIWVFMENVFGMSFYYNHEWWFIFPYILSVIVFSVVKPRINNIYKLTIIIIISLSLYMFMDTYISIISPIDTINNLDYNIRNFLFWLPSFLMGYYFFNHNILEKYHVNIWHSFLIIICVFLIKTYILNTSILDFIFGSLIIIAVIPIIRKFHIVSRILVYFGTKSTVIWLTHTFFCYYIFQTIFYASHNVLLTFISVILACLLVSYPVEYLVRKINNKLF